MPALESRRVRTQPLNVTGVSLGARPARTSSQVTGFIVQTPACVEAAAHRGPSLGGPQTPACGCPARLQSSTQDSFATRVGPPCVAALLTAVPARSIHALRP